MISVKKSYYEQLATYHWQEGDKAFNKCKYMCWWLSLFSDMQFYNV